LFTCTARNLEYILEHLGEEAGVPHKISFEMMRWTSAVRDFQAGVDPNTIREKLGLSKISWVETFRKIRQLAGENVEPASEQAAS
jgi:integrase/recombinase XerD